MLKYYSIIILTQVLDAVTRLVQCSRVKFETDNGKDDNGEQHQQTDLKQRRHGFDDGFEHHLQTLVVRCDWKHNAIEVCVFKNVQQRRWCVEKVPYRRYSTMWYRHTRMTELVDYSSNDSNL